MADYYTINPFKRNVSLVLSLIDCYTGRAVAGEHINVILKGGFRKAVMKTNGFYVFVDLPPGIWEFSIVSNEYFNEIVVVDTSCSDLIVKVNIVPNRNYKLPKKSTFIDTVCPKGTKIYVVPLGLDNPVKLKKYADSIISVRTSSNINLSNQTLAFFNGEELDVFEADEAVQKNVYALRHIFTGVYKAGANIYPVSIGKADDSGYVFCPVRGFYEWHKEILIKVECVKETFYKRFNIVYGKGNSIYV